MHPSGETFSPAQDQWGLRRSCARGPVGTYGAPYFESLGHHHVRVSAYARRLASAGDHVEVWTPAGSQPKLVDPGVSVYPLPDRFGPASWRALDRGLRDTAGRPREVTLLLQYVPQGFGLRVMNLPFLVWLASRREPLWVMVHEAVFPFIRGQPLKHHVLAIVTRIMLGTIGSRADRTFVSVPAWLPYLKKYARLRHTPEWLPVPSNLPTTSNAISSELRARFGIPERAELLVHFGSYGGVVVAPLRAAAARLLSGYPDRWLLLVGRNSERFRDELARAHPDLAGRLVGTGEAPPQEVADALHLGDLAVYTFPDGVSGRRGSLMAALALGVPVLATEGASTESFWWEQQVVALVPAWNAEALADAVTALLKDPARRADLASRGRAAYAKYFSIERTSETLRTMG
jgi:glycosyltransferase involved in cell wall biosynthesis